MSTVLASAGGWILRMGTIVPIFRFQNPIATTARGPAEAAQ